MESSPESSGPEPEERPLVEQKKPLDKFELLLPESIYTTCFIRIVKLMEAFRTGRRIGMQVCLVLPEVCFLGFSILCQVGLTSYLQMELEKRDPCNANKSRGLMWIGAAAFTGNMLQEVMETIGISWWMLEVEAFDSDLAGFEEIQLLNSHRVIGFLFVVLPKLAIAGYLTWVGNRFVLLSETDTDLVLNCVAMTFVIEIDELILATLSSQLNRRMVQNLKPVETGRWKTYTALDQTVLTPILRPAVWAGVVAYFIHNLPQC